jgi:TetR/AcrR family transcriptional regulator, regulator of cefoperazone and chloramphenicol sensitivity
MVQTIDLISDVAERPSAAMRLIYSAGPLFAERPFDAVSTRELAKAAKVNLSAISYHFGSKAGLYETILQTIVQELAPVRTLLVGAVEDGLRNAKNDPERLLDLLSGFVEAIIRGVTSKDNPRWRMKLAIREMQHPSEHADILMDGHVNIMHDAIGGLLAAIKNKPADSAEIRLLAHSIMVSCLQFGLNDVFVCKRMGWQSYGPEEINTIVALMKDTVRNMAGLSAPIITNTGKTS